VALVLSGYRKGYRLERRVEGLYSQHGWLATRFPKSGRGSHLGDVLAVKRFRDGTLIHLVECKNLSKPEQGRKALYIQPDQVQGLLEEARRHHAQALVAYSFPRQHARILEATRLKSSGKMFLIEPEDGTPIKRFLKSCNQKRESKYGL